MQSGRFLFVRRFVMAIALVLPTVLALGWSVAPAVRAGLAAALMNKPALDDTNGPQLTTALKRKIQKHFLDHTVYIPLEDIVLAHNSDDEKDSLTLLMQKACGRGKLYIWIPLKFRLPIVGEKVFEWCWKPKSASV